MNLLLLLVPGHWRLAKAFNKYVNVYPYFIDRLSPSHILHDIPGKLKARYKIFPDPLLYFAGKLLNRKHYTTLRDITPEDIDLVFVSDPVCCRIDLKPFRNAVKAYWSHDSCFPTPYYTQIFSTRIQDFDIIFCAHTEPLKRFEKLGCKVYHLPFTFDPDICIPLNIEEQYDLAFVGTMDKRRAEIIRHIKEMLPSLDIFVGSAWHHDMTRIYNQARIVLNISRATELNTRVFEALGCKRLLLTDRSREVEELFHDGEHLVMYDDIDSLVDNVKEYIENHDERRRIASSGFNEVTQKHTMYHRAEEVLKACKK
jgi:glycosyltransferase involved in cell wall biosynthesis